MGIGLVHIHVVLTKWSSEVTFCCVAVGVSSSESDSEREWVWPRVGREWETEGGEL